MPNINLSTGKGSGKAFLFQNTGQAAAALFVKMSFNI